MRDDIDVVKNAAMTSDEDLAKMTMEDLGEMYAGIMQAIGQATEQKYRVIEALETRYSDELSGMRVGTTTIARGDMELKVTRPKRVSWNQQGLSHLWEYIAENWTHEPEDFIGIKYSVDERKYGNWPDEVKAMFETYRTVKPGQTTVAFRRLHDEEDG